MAIFDYSRLIEKIRVIFKTQRKFAEEMNMGRTSLNLRLNNKAEFTAQEIIKACELLDISKDDIPSYFFTQKVQKHEQ